MAPHDLHWNPNLPRHGLGENLKQIHCYTINVSNLEKSVSFYYEVMKFDLVTMIEGVSALFNAKNMMLELKVGKSHAFSGKNLIVGHIAIDVQDAQMAFDYLTLNEIPFEINVSVPKGVGKAESEGGSSDNTVGQAFIRDPDGFYFEICNCHVLTDFVLGKDRDLDSYNETCPNIMYIISQMEVKVQRAKMALPTLKFEPLPEHLQPERRRSTIYHNFVKRHDVYGDICQSFRPSEINVILRQAGNNAGNAILIMKELIEKKEVERVYEPPAYYVNKVDKDFKYKPEPLSKGDPKKDNLSDSVPELTAGVALLGQSNSPDEIDWSVLKDFEIYGINHIAFIVSDVGLSSIFYSEVLGLQAVKRPNFDRHGAWFTGGNTEIHLILGNPLAPERTEKASEVPVMWLSVNDLNAAKESWNKMAAEALYSFDIQVEMVKGGVTIRDPDGYVFGACSV